jgi:hypothetical protein
MTEVGVNHTQHTSHVITTSPSAIRPLSHSMIALSVPDALALGSFIAIGTGMAFLLRKIHRLKRSNRQLQGELLAQKDTFRLCSELSLLVSKKILILEQNRGKEVTFRSGSYQKTILSEELIDVLTIFNAHLLGVEDRVHGSISKVRANTINKIQLSKLPPSWCGELRSIMRQASLNRLDADITKPLRALIEESQILSTTVDSHAMAK